MDFVGQVQPRLCLACGASVPVRQGPPRRFCIECATSGCQWYSRICPVCCSTVDDNRTKSVGIDHACYCSPECFSASHPEHVESLCEVCREPLDNRDFPEWMRASMHKDCGNSRAAIKRLLEKGSPHYRKLREFEIARLYRRGVRLCPDCGAEVRIKKWRRGIKSKRCDKCKSTRKCAACGVKFSVDGGWRKNCPRCQEHARARRKSGSMRARLCEYCGASFLAHSRKQKGCSRRCSHMLNRMRVVHVSGTCPGCTHVFSRGVHPDAIKNNYPHVEYCCVECYHAHSDKNRGHRRRAKVRGGSDVTVKALRDRDGSNCRLCGERLDFSITGRTPESIAIDHIVPLANGGRHTMANCQLAHYGCNSRKQNLSSKRITCYGETRTEEAAHAVENQEWKLPSHARRWGYRAVSHPYASNRVS